MSYRSGLDKPCLQCRALAARVRELEAERDKLHAAALAFRRWQDLGGQVSRLPTGEQAVAWDEVVRAMEECG